MKILLFHHSDKPRNWLTDHEKDYPTYFWFSDRFQELSGIVAPSRFVYFFLIDADEIGKSLEARPLPSKLDSIYATFVERKKEFGDLPTNGVWLPEPPFFKSYKQMKPVLSLEYNEKTMDYQVLSPESFAGKRCRLFDKQFKRKRFSEIKLLREAIPEITQALPLMAPG